MNVPLYDKIDIANQFALKPEYGIPVVDHSEQVSMAFDLVSRMAAPKQPDVVKQMPAIMPVAN